MNERDYLIINLNDTIDRLQKYNWQLSEIIESSTQIIRFYIEKHDTIDQEETVKVLRDVLEDIEAML